MSPNHKFPELLQKKEPGQAVLSTLLATPRFNPRASRLVDRLVLGIENAPSRPRRVCLQLVKRILEAVFIRCLRTERDG